MIIFGQFLDVILASLLIVRIIQLGLQPKYKAFLVFVGYDSFQSILVLLYLGLNATVYLDYRILWCVMQILSWITSIWVVYALLISILKRLPGILRFSMWLLNTVFGGAVLLALFTIKPESVAAGLQNEPDFIARVTRLVGIVGRALSFAELLAISLTLLFILLFPIRVPRNLAVFSAGFSVYLCLQIGFQLMRSYIPGFETSRVAEGAPGFVIAGCLLYWIFNFSQAGEEADATLGRNWKSVPQDHLVRQLEAMNAALLRSREQS